MPKIADLLGKHFCDLYMIDDEQKYVIEMVPARSLLVYNRIDIVAKYKYVDFYVNCYDMKFISEVYKKHLEAITCGTYMEVGQNKHSFKRYIDDFEDLIIEIYERGIDENRSVIPVGRNNSIMDGAHRTAISAYFNRDVPIIRFEQLYPCNDTVFFQNQYLEQKYLDYLVTEYIKLKKNIYIACFWPRALDKGKELFVAENIIKQNLSVVYKKNVKLNYQGLKNLMIQIYSDKDWMGGVETGFKGAEGKADACYATNETIKIYVIEGIELQQILEIKEEIRDVFNLGNHSIHITDTLEEAIQMADLVFNRNSLDLMNRGEPSRDINLNRMVESFRNNIQSKHLRLEQFIIDSSSVMGLYGIRKCQDLDYLTLEELDEEVKVIFGDCHEEYLKYYNKTKDMLILNPENYLVYHKVKFVNLEVLHEFKKNRGEEKDVYDNILIEKFNKSEIHSEDKKFLMKIRIKRLKRNIQSNIWYRGTELLKKINLYEKSKKIYHLIKDMHK